MSITGRSSIRRLKDVAVVVGLHELAPVGRCASSGRERRRHEIGQPVQKLKSAKEGRVKDWRRCSRL